MRVLFLIMDGLGDLPNESLEGKTPLEFAKAHYLKKLGKEGETGLMTTIDYGVVPGSDTAHLACLLYTSPSPRD
jgi:2,3-bisphosphoglycerate-independent phosphoglycerate mutase